MNVHALRKRFIRLTWRSPDKGTLKRHQPTFRAALERLGCSVREFLAVIDDETLALAIRRDLFAAEAFEALLVDRYEETTQRWLRSWGVGPADADDVIADVRLFIWLRRLPSFDPAEGPFRYYYWKIVRNRWLDGRRRAWRSHGLDEVAEPTDPHHGPDEFAQLHELDGRLQQALGQLSERRRQVLQATLEGKAAAAIAKELGLSLPTIYGIRFRVRRVLEGLL